MREETASDFYDELEETIRQEMPVRLVYIGRLIDEETLLRMWEEGSLSL